MLVGKCGINQTLQRFIICLRFRVIKGRVLLVDGVGDRTWLQLTGRHHGVRAWYGGLTNDIASEVLTGFTTFQDIQQEMTHLMMNTVTSRCFYRNLIRHSLPETSLTSNADISGYADLLELDLFAHLIDSHPEITASRLV